MFQELRTVHAVSLMTYMPYCPRTIYKHKLSRTTRSHHFLFTLHVARSAMRIPVTLPHVVFSMSQVLFTLFSQNTVFFCISLIQDFARHIVSTSRADGWRVVFGLRGLQTSTKLCCQSLHVHALDAIAQKHYPPKPCHSDRNTNFRCKLHDVQVTCRCRNCCPAALDRGA